MQYIRADNSHIVHKRTDCRHMVALTKTTRPMIASARKPSHCTVCDECQRLEKKDRRS